MNNTKVRNLRLIRDFILFSFLVIAILILLFSSALPGRCYVPDDLDFVPMEEEMPPGQQGQVQGGVKTITVASINYRMVHIPPGTFMMGSPSDEKDREDDEVRHKVTLTHGFYLGATEVTVGQFRKFVKETGYTTEAEKEEGSYVWTGSGWEMKKNAHWQNSYFEQEEANPVVCVSWNDTKAFCEWLSRKEGKTYRLPTEAEWEYACRAGTDKPFSSGLCLSTEQANYDGNYPYQDCAKGIYRGKTLPVDSFPPNPWGLYNMHGNVWEWCGDWYGEYPSGSVSDPKGLSSGSNRVFRGGSWSSFARYCRAAFRNRDTPDNRFINLGFRLSRTL